MPFSFFQCQGSSGQFFSLQTAVTVFYSFIFPEFNCSNRKAPLDKRVNPPLHIWLTKASSDFKIEVKLGKRTRNDQTADIMLFHENIIIIMKNHNLITL